MIPHIKDIQVVSARAPAPGHPVFILNGPVGKPSYVVKKENFASDYGMKGVYQNPFDGELTPQKEQARKNALAHVEARKRSYTFIKSTYAACLDWFPDTRVIEPFELAATLTKLQSLNTNNCLFDQNFANEQKSNREVVASMWTIMDCVSGLFDMKQIIDKGNETAVRNVAVAVQRNERVVEELGRIVALDCFFGNGDRVGFNFDYNSKTWAWSAVNLGNFFVVKTGMGDQCIFAGIDFWDPLRNWMNLEGNFDEQDSDELAPWPGPFLKKGALEIKGQAGRVLDDLNNALRAKGRPAIFEEAHKVAMARGFVDGAGRLKKYLNKTTEKPAGVKRRKARLGW